jgi:poly-gamma-glutamate synthesis protein (capsule biosynthesis protein)
MPFRLRFLVPLLFSLIPACAAPAGDADDDGGEPADTEDALVAMDEPDETAPAGAGSLAAAPLDATEAANLLDVRGMGDSGWSNTHEQTPIAADFGKALDRFDASGKGYRGDLSFINWETVVGSGCSQFASAYSPGKSYAFVSRSENLVQANERGFNLIGLSNNHSRDCLASADTVLRGEVASAAMTAKNIEGLGERSWLFAGLASTAHEDDAAKARVRTFTVKGRQVRVAFGSMYMGRPDCPRAACAGDKRELFESMRDAHADVRILSLHSMGATDQDEAVRTGIEFVKNYGGDVVYGEGPHVWKPVRVVRKGASFGGGTGVVFESLGNFLHPSLGGQAKNFIGRALFDLRTLKLRQVQVLPVANAGRDVKWSAVDGGALQANLRWSPATHGVYANVKP